MVESKANPRVTRLFALAYGLAAIAAIAAGAVADDSLPALAPLGLFLALGLWAENWGIPMPSKITVSPSLMVVMAAIGAMDDQGVYVGVAAVGAANGLTLGLVTNRRYSWLLLNSSQFVLSSIVAAVTYNGAAGLPEVARVAVTCLAFAATNVGLVLPGVVVMYREPASAVWADMRPALPGYLAFGLLGALVGELYDSLGPLAVVLLLTPVVIARATFNSYIQLTEAHDATIRVFLRAIQAKDEYTGRHTLRVRKYSMYIGAKLGLSHARLQHLERAALMHDIGKLAVPKHLLNKPGKLTDEEFQRVQKHAHVCIDILDLVDFLKPMTAAAAGHHARYDGGGYGGTGERPLEAYIVAVADAYDAMTSTRSYRRALTMETAFGELRAKSGSQFHPDCVEALIGAITERGEVHGLGYEEDAVAFEVPPPVAGLGSAGLGDRAEQPPQAPAAPVLSTRPAERVAEGVES
ncbi:MAG TPA: HD domain-containing phosphohydrolase [Acidimicrobiales bacterium]